VLVIAAVAVAADTGMDFLVTGGRSRSLISPSSNSDELDPPPSLSAS
jgi:hypothetical protein